MALAGMTGKHLHLMGNPACVHYFALVPFRDDERKTRCSHRGWFDPGWLIDCW